jgi:ankyrin repeat protein
MDPNKLQDQHMVIEHLKKHPDEVSCVDDDENSLLQIYSAERFKDLQDFLLETFPEIVHSQNFEGRNALFDAVDSANPYLVRRILEISPDALWTENDNGETPFEYDMQYNINNGIFEAILPFVRVEDVGLPELWKLTKNSLASYKKAVLMLETFPELFDYREHGEYSILAVVARSCFSYAQPFIKYICSKRPDLLLEPDVDGMLPSHVALTYDALDLMHTYAPECLTAKDNDGNAPFHYTKIFTRQTSLDNLLKARPDILTIPDKNGLTLPMILVMTNSVPGSVLNRVVKNYKECVPLEDTKGNTLLHYAAECKRVGWGALCGIVAREFPELVLKKNTTGLTALDIALENSGDVSSRTEKETFFAACAEVCDLPDDIWNAFTFTSRSIEKSFGSILKRSEVSAAKAFGLLSSKYQHRIHTVLKCSKSLPRDIVVKIIVKVTQT